MNQPDGIRMPKILWVAIPVLLLALIFGSDSSAWPQATLWSYLRIQTFVAAILGGVTFYKLGKYLKYQNRYNERIQVLWYVVWWVSLTVICGLFMPIDFMKISVYQIHVVDALYLIGLLPLGYFTLLW